MMEEKKTPELTPDQLENFRKIEVARRDAMFSAEIAFGTKLHGMYLESYAHKQRIASQWDYFVQFTKGKQWPTRRPRYKVDAIINFVIENIERKTALLTDAKPIPKVVPYKDSLQDTADILNDLLRVIFQQSEFDQANVDMITNSQVFGSGFLETIYDRDANNGKGDIRVVSCDPRAVNFDPLVPKSYLLGNGEFIVLEDIWALEKARDLFPERADMIRPDPGLSKFEAYQGPGTFMARVSNILKLRDATIFKSEIPRVHMREFYMRDRSKASGKLRFRNGSRKVVMAGSIIVMDGDNPYIDSEFPIDMLSWHTDFNTAWGWGDVELLRSPQELYNKIMALVVENLTLTSNAIWIGDADALDKDDWEKLNNKPGGYVKKKPGRELRREPGLGFPDYVLKVLEYLEKSKDTLTGMVDVMRGVRTGQVSSGVGIESLQLMAQALVRLRSRSIEALHARVGKKLISRIFQYYEPDRIIEVLKLANRDELYTTYESELLKPIKERKLDWATELSFKIEPGSSLGMAKTQRRIESMRLREMQVIDDEALLNDLEYPHRDKVLKRVSQKRQDEANQEVAGQAQQGGKATQFPAQANASPAGRTK